MMSGLRVELFFDEEAGNWHYRACPLSHSPWKAIPATTDRGSQNISSVHRR